jgi:hypothetical protein
MALTKHTATIRNVAVEFYHHDAEPRDSLLFFGHGGNWQVPQCCFGKGDWVTIPIEVVFYEPHASVWSMTKVMKMLTWTAEQMEKEDPEIESRHHPRSKVQNYYLYPHEKQAEAFLEWLDQSAVILPEKKKMSAPDGVIISPKEPAERCITLGSLLKYVKKHYPGVSEFHYCACRGQIG